MMDFDTPEQFDLSCHEDINQSLLEAQVLAARLAIMRSEGASFGELHEASYNEVMEITDLFSLYDDTVTYTYSGEGFIPIYDYASGEIKTAFAQTTGRGRFSSFSLLDPEEIVFIEFEEGDLEDSEEQDSDVLVEGEKSVNTDFLRHPQEGYNLYLEFLTKKQSDSEMIVGGIAARSYDTAFFNIMDLARLTVEHIEISPPVELVPEYDVVDIMIDAANRARLLKRETTFRRYSKKRQMQYLDSAIEELNQKLGLERVSIAVDTPQFYVSSPHGKDRQLCRVSCKEGDSQLFITPIRVDCLDSYGLPRGSRIISDRSLVHVGAGLYLVGSLEEHVSTRMNLASSVIWIPLADKTPEDFVVIPQNSIG